MKDSELRSFVESIKPHIPELVSRLGPEREITKPDHAFCEQLCQAFTLAAHGLRIGADPTYFPLHRTATANGWETLADQRLWSRRYASLILEAIPYVWPHEIRLAAVGSGELPAHATDDLHLPFDRMYWTWPSQLNLGEDPDGQWMLLFRQSDGSHAAVSLYASDESRNYETRSFVWSRPGLTYPDGYPNPRGYAAIAKMLGFLQSESFDSSGQPVSRPLRRSIGIKGRQEVPLVHFVLLPGARSESAAHTQQSVEWNVRWLVSGHWRNQWLPASQTHRLRWIAPYVKGPADKPFRPPVYKVGV